MAKIVIVVILALVSVVLSKPVEKIEDEIEYNVAPAHTIQKRFVNPSLTGGFEPEGFSKMRTKRSEEEDCEKLRLCRMHARANRSFFASFELYFVNRENARLWDHHARSMAECNERFSCYER